MIQLIVGPMFAGKSSEMYRLLRREDKAKKSVLVLRHDVDNRDFVTHDKATMPFEYTITPSLREVDSEVQNYDVIGVDEGQFFPQLVKYTNKWANEGRKVVVAGLSGTSEMKQWKSIRDLYGLADTVTRLNAVCSECGSDHGSYSYLIDGEKEDYLLIGDSNRYAALCRPCMLKKDGFKK